MCENVIELFVDGELNFWFGHAHDFIWSQSDSSSHMLEHITYPNSELPRLRSSIFEQQHLIETAFVDNQHGLSDSFSFR